MIDDLPLPREQANLGPNIRHFSIVKAWTIDVINGSLELGQDNSVQGLFIKIPYGMDGCVTMMFGKFIPVTLCLHYGLTHL